MRSKILDRATTFARLHIPKASELLAQRVRAAIMRRDLTEGVPLPSEKELVEQMGVSRATVREGLRLLEAEGLITTRAGRGGGAVVRRPSEFTHTRSLALLLGFDGTTLRELLEARQVIEPPCARLAAQHGTPGQLAELHRMLSELHELTGDPEAYLALQVRFHLLIVQAAQNNVLRIYATSLAELTYEQIRHVPFTREHLVEGIGGCAAILEAIEQRDGEWAARRLAKHLRAIEETLLVLDCPLDREPAAIADLSLAERA